MPLITWKKGTKVILVRGPIPTGFRGIFSSKSRYSIPNGARGVVMGHKYITLGPHPRDFYHLVRFTWADPRTKKRHSHEIGVEADWDIIKA